MEKDSSEDISNSEDTSENNEEDEELSEIEKKMILLAKQHSLQEDMDRLREQILLSKQRLVHFQDQFFQAKSSGLQIVPLSPIESSNCESESLSESSVENLRDSPILTGSLKHCDTLAKQSIDISNKLQYFKAIMESHIMESPSISPISHRETSDNDTQSSAPHSESDTRFETQSDLEIKEIDERFRRNSCGKGKEAASKTYRYQKRSKPVSTSESLTTDTLVQHSEGLITPESKTLDSEASKVELASICPATKRKRSDSNEGDDNRLHLDESYASTSNFSGNHGNDNEDSKPVKKTKTLHEELNRQYPTIEAFLDEKNYESIDLAQFMDQPQTSQISSESEDWNMPSTSGLSNVGRLVSNNEESSLESGNESEQPSE